MLRIPTILSLLVLAAGCATGIQRDLPQCDGRNKRPLNVGLWHPEEADRSRPVRASTEPTVLFTPDETKPAVPPIIKSYTPVDQSAAPVPFAILDVAAPVAPASSC